MTKPSAFYSMNKTQPVYQVSDLVNEMRNLMEMSYPEIWIEGELSSLSTPASGHIYFSLKDTTSQLRCAMFRGRVSVNRYKPKAGDLVRVRAKISVYTARGDLQCIAQYIEEAGEGLLQRRFEELKNKLSEQGMFSIEHKKALPAFPKKIGLITSPTGAAVKDILSTLKRRCPGIPIVIYPAVVQGDMAAKSLIDAINSACQHKRCDTLILARGGGSMEDLWCFNDEALANSIFNCPIPIVSGVGHEVDVTVADLVADQRAPTPTAAAELLSPDTSQLINQLRNLSLRLSNAARRDFELRAQKVDNRFGQLVHPKQQLKDKRERLSQKMQRLQYFSEHLLKSPLDNIKKLEKRLFLLTPTKQIAHLQQCQQSFATRLLYAQRQQLKSLSQQYDAASRTLDAVSPLRTLDRGFAIARDQNKEILRNIKQTKIEDKINVQLKSGSLTCIVESVD